MAKVDRELAKRIVDFLNELLELEPDTVHQLITHQFRCGGEFAQHPSVQVWAPNEAQPYPRVTLLGLLNGLAGADADGRGAVAAQFDNQETDPELGLTGDLVEFEVLDRG